MSIDFSHAETIYPVWWRHHISDRSAASSPQCARLHLAPPASFPQRHGPQTAAFGFCAPPAGVKRAWLACPPAGASCAGPRRPPWLPRSCRDGRPSPGDGRAAASPALSQRTTGIASAPQCPGSDAGGKFSLVHFVLDTHRQYEKELMSIKECICLDTLC